MNVYTDITKTIGRTPLIKMQRIGKDLPGEILLKLEFFNPLGSVKDRIGLAMIEKAELEGKLKPGMEILEPTSGNTGISLAFICAAKGYPLTLVMPEQMSQERRVLLLLFGAKLILTPARYGMPGTIAKVRELFEHNPHYFIPSQFENLANPEIHKETTALEIWHDTEGKVDIVVSGVGTGGTITGVGEVLQAKKPSVKMVAVEPLESPVISGGKAGPHLIQGTGAGFIPPILNTKLIDAIEKVASQEAIDLARAVIKQEGIPFGISSGAALVAALRMAEKKENAGKTIVTIIPSYTDRYLSTLLAKPETEIAKDLAVTAIDEQYLSRS